MKIALSIFVSICIQTGSGFTLAYSTMPNKDLIDGSENSLKTGRLPEFIWIISNLGKLSTLQSLDPSSSKGRVSRYAVEDSLYGHLAKAAEIWNQGLYWTISRSEARAGLRREIFTVARCPDTVAIVNASKRLWKVKSKENEMVLELLDPLIFYPPVVPSQSHLNDVLPWRIINGKLSLSDDYPLRGATTGRPVRLRIVSGPFGERRSDLGQYLKLSNHRE